MARPVLLALLLALACRDPLPAHERVTPSGGWVRLPLAAVADGRVHFYSVESGGKRINFFVRSDAKRRLHAHLDACHACYRYRRGYAVEDGAVVCRACRYRYPLADEAWRWVGACVPIDLPFTVREGALWIGARSLARAERYF